jgi:hypothetical protein
MIPNRFRDEGEHRFRDEAEQFQAAPDPRSGSPE